MGERGVGRAEVRVGRMVRKKREKREMERDVVVGEEGSIFLVGVLGDGGRGVVICWCCCWFERGGLEVRN